MLDFKEVYFYCSIFEEYFFGDVVVKCVLYGKLVVCLIFEVFVWDELF